MVEGADQGLLDDLSWLGLEFAGTPLIRQSDRRDLHVAAAADLLATAHAYRCFCPPSQERYDGRCRALPRADAQLRHEAGEPNVIRFRVPSADVVVDDATRGPVRFAADEISDFVLVRADGRPTFDLATAVDDRDLAITHIVRGEDYLANSARHLLLLRALGTIEPIVFAHCPIIVGADGERLSTRRGGRAPRSLCEGEASRLKPWSQTPLSSPAPPRAAPARWRHCPSSRSASRSSAQGAALHMPTRVPLAWLGREVLAGLPSAELARRLARVPPHRTPDSGARRAGCGRERRLGARGRRRRGRALAQSPQGQRRSRLRSSCFATCGTPTSASTRPTRRPWR